MVNIAISNSQKIFFIEFLTSLQTGAVNVAKILLENGAEVNLQNRLGVLPIHLAAEYGNIFGRCFMNETFIRVHPILMIFYTFLSNNLNKVSKIWSNC